MQHIFCNKEAKVFQWVFQNHKFKGAKTNLEIQINTKNFQLSKEETNKAHNKYIVNLIAIGNVNSSQINETELWCSGTKNSPCFL